MSHYHAVVWIDHQRATVWQFTSTEQTNTVIHAHDQHQRVHSRKSTHGGHKSPADRQFFDDATRALEDAHEIAASVKYAIVEAIPSVAGVLVHMEPYRSGKLSGDPVLSLPPA